MAKCRVKFEREGSGVVAVLYAKDGRSLNLVRGFKRMPGLKTRAKVRGQLMRGCAELSRR